MIENQWLTVDLIRALRNLNFVVHPIPCSQIVALMLRNNYALKPLGPVIQIFLIGEPARLAPVKTPLHAALTPPLKTLMSEPVIAEREQTYVVGAIVFAPPGGVDREAVGNDQD